MFAFMGVPPLQEPVRAALIARNRAHREGMPMGPLAGVKIVEFTGIGPAPMAAMMLADMGATVLRIDRPGPSDLGVPIAADVDFTKRSRPAIGIDLKKPDSVALALKLLDTADALIEGFRPGVMERLGLGPDVCLK